MRRGLAGLPLLAVLLVLATTALALPGDILVVGGDRVNLRAAPSKDADVVGRLTRGEVVIERERSGEWIRVDLGGGHAGGWTHGSFLKSLGLKEPSAASGGPGFAAFQAKLEGENLRVFAATGVYPYLAARDLGDAMVIVEPSDDWLVNGRNHAADALRLFDLWKKENAGRSVTLTISDRYGNVYITVQDTDSDPLLTVHY